MMNALVSFFHFNQQGNTCHWGCGSICNGKSVTGAFEGNMVYIAVNTFYCDGEVEADTRDHVRVPISRLWEFLPEEIFRA